MELQLKHLAPYLPYDLRMVHNADCAGNFNNHKNITDYFYNMPTAILTNF